RSNIRDLLCAVRVTLEAFEQGPNAGEDDQSFLWSWRDAVLKAVSQIPAEFGRFLAWPRIHAQLDIGIVVVFNPAQRIIRFPDPSFDRFDMLIETAVEH